MPPDSDVVYEWRGEVDNGEVDNAAVNRLHAEVDNAAVNRLHAEGFEHPLLDIDWRTQLDSHSPGWVCARPSLAGWSGS